MSGIKDYSTTPASNTALFPEGMAPSAVNDGMRQVQADVRDGFDNLPWFNLGYTCTQASGTTFTISGDKTADFTTYRAIRIADSATLYGYVVSSSYSAPNTTVTVQLITGSLSSSMNGQTVSLGTTRPSSSSLIPALPKNVLYGLHLYAADAGASDTYAITLVPSPTGYETGMAISFKANTANTGAATLNVNSLGAKTIKKNVSSDLSDNDILANQCVEVIYDGTNFQLISPPSTGGQPFIDSTALVRGSSDSSKLLRFEVDGLTTATTRVWTIQDTDVSNAIVQRVSTSSASTQTGTTTLPVDDTKPQNTEGDEYMTLAVTPKNTNNILVIELLSPMNSHSSTGALTGALFQDSTADALATSFRRAQGAGIADGPMYLRHIMAAGTTSSTTFKFRMGSDAVGTTTFNGGGGARFFGGAQTAFMMITEYAA